MIVIDSWSGTSKVVIYIYIRLRGHLSGSLEKVPTALTRTKCKKTSVQKKRTLGRIHPSSAIVQRAVPDFRVNYYLRTYQIVVDDLAK